MEDKFKKLKEQLDLLDWPSVYLFKFITPSDNQLIAKITRMFDEKSAITIRPSSKGTYTSISIKEVMLNAESVIDIYEKTAKIKGVIII